MSRGRRVVSGRRAEIVAVPVLEKRLGSLPVIAEFCRRLDIAGVIDRACPIRDLADATHGQVIEVLIGNRLTNPAAMVGVAGWAQAWAVQEVYGLPAAILGDDRLARALDAIAPHVDQIIGSVGAAAIDGFGIDVARLHWDMTSVSLHGAYDEVQDGFPAPGWGHPKDRRTDLKQIQAGIAVASDGGVPIFHQAYDGGAGEISQVVEAMQRLQALAGPRRFLLVGDSKLLSYGNITAMSDAGVGFIAPLAAARVPAGLFAALDPQTAVPVDYTALRDAGKPADRRGAYRVVEDVMDIPGPRKRDPVHQLRRVLVHSTANQTAAVKARTLKLDKARTELDTLTRTAGTRHHPDTAAVTAKAEQISRHRRVSSYLRTQVTEHPDTGKPVFAWHYDQTAIDAEAATDGWYALLSNLPPQEADAAEILRRYKNQPVVEQRYATIKGPLAVAPMFLRHNRRITALITVICLALLIFSLIEREVRTNLAPNTEMIGFYAYDNRAVRPTGRLILQALHDLRLIPAHDQQPPRIPQPGWLQAQLLALLNTDPTRPRW
ncbi:IS1634 family transposase [Dactylosporangium sp. NBC_01737]|uniref:IS1634 family transposase n=1 Tax=Dactylosporangium sp. NBC_01737 TaxID=2975959 RepID=UPI002E133A65|nr:IS1634 family transposase [Dactylosporangium sp. NBC_01737]WSG47654.1 IS1634 family transposase [Dactylosporangium sp. NBC_01737]